MCPLNWVSVGLTQASASSIPHREVRDDIIISSVLKGRKTNVTKLPSSATKLIGGTVQDTRDN